MHMHMGTRSKRTSADDESSLVAWHTDSHERGAVGHIDASGTALQVVMSRSIVKNNEQTPPTIELTAASAFCTASGVPVMVQTRIS